MAPCGCSRGLSGKGVVDAAGRREPDVAGRPGCFWIEARHGGKGAGRSRSIRRRISTNRVLGQRLAALGVVTLADSAVAEWHGDGATVVNLLDNSTRRVESDALVLATINVSETSLLDALGESGLEVHAVGDCIAPRRANNAFFEGRRLGLKL